MYACFFAIETGRAAAIVLGTISRVKLKISEYLKLRDEFGEEFIKNQIDLLDEYLEINNNKNKESAMDFPVITIVTIKGTWIIKVQLKACSNKATI